MSAVRCPERRPDPHLQHGLPTPGKQHGRLFADAVPFWLVSAIVTMAGAPAHGADREHSAAAAAVAGWRRLFPFAGESAAGSCVRRRCACDPRTWTTSSWPAGTARPRLAAVISDRQPDVLIAKRRPGAAATSACFPSPRRRLPSSGQPRSPSRLVGHPPCNGLPDYGDRARVPASDRRDRTNRSELRSWNAWSGSNRRSSDYEPDARRRPGRIWSDLACSRWALRRSRRLPTEPEGSSG